MQHVNFNTPCRRYICLRLPTNVTRSDPIGAFKAEARHRAIVQACHVLELFAMCQVARKSQDCQDCFFHAQAHIVKEETVYKVYIQHYSYSTVLVLSRLGPSSNTDAG